MMRVLVFGRCFDIEFEEWSNRLIKEFEMGLKVVVISDLTLRELEEAPSNVRSLVEGIPREHKGFVILDDEARGLAHRYIEERIVTEEHREVVYEEGQRI